MAASMGSLFFWKAHLATRSMTCLSSVLLVNHHPTPNWRNSSQFGSSLCMQGIIDSNSCNQQTQQQVTLHHKQADDTSRSCMDKGRDKLMAATGVIFYKHCLYPSTKQQYITPHSTVCCDYLVSLGVERPDQRVGLESLTLQRHTVDQGKGGQQVDVLSHG